MTVNIQLETIATAIAALSVSGVNIKDIDTVPESAIDYCPVLYPTPNGFVTDLQPEIVSLGGDSVRALNISYTLNYTFLYAPIGSGSVLANYAGLITKLALILEKILATSTLSGSVDIFLLSVSNIGAMTDVAGQNQYHGVDISFRVLEYVQ